MGPPPIGRPTAALLALVMALLAAAPQLATAQMESPLKGQGIPELNTTTVFVSAYLDRLLHVDDAFYRHEMVIYFFITWSDPTAVEKVRNATASVLGGGRSCSRPCSNKVDGVQCCDGIYVPSFFFRNAYGFPQDRLVGYTFHFPEDNQAVMWEVRVHGTFYQPMSFRNYPFDSFDLQVELQFISTASMAPGHPGVNVSLSTGGIKLYSVGLGDDTSQWTATEATGFIWEEFSDGFSDWLDPMPLNAAPGAPYKNAFEAGGLNDTCLELYITVERFWRFHLINSVLPVTLVALLGLFIFALDHRDLGLRLELIITLFLSLTAVQFVLQDRRPTSSYVVPTQQYVLTTYVLLMLISIESIVVFHISFWRERRELSRNRRAAQQRHVAERRGKSAPVGSAAQLASQDLSNMEGLEKEGSVGPGSAPPQGAQGQRQQQNGGRGGGLFLRRFWSNERQEQARLERMMSSSSNTSAMTGLQRLEADDAYAQHVAHVIDIVTCATLGLGFCLTGILIFVLQHGYTDLFQDV